MNEFFTVVENQIRPDGSPGLLYDHFMTSETVNNPETGETFELTAEDRALAKYFTTCAAAVKSGIPYHSVQLQSSNGIMVKQEIFDRRTAEAVETEE